MTVEVQKEDAAELSRIEKEARKLEFELAALVAQRGEILNRILSDAGVAVGENAQITTPPDWSKLLVTNGKTQTT